MLRSFLSALIRQGRIEIETANGETFEVGDGSGDLIAIRFNDALGQLRFILTPELAFGELYMDGHVDVTKGTIYDVLALAARNYDLRPRWLNRLQALRSGWFRRRDRNDAQRSLRNVAHHYDLDSRLYALFLDSDRQYSCAYFERPDDDLDRAQLAKKRHIAAKLLIEAGQTVLDIGCGWGGLGLYLAQVCGAQVTGITLSKEQLAIAQGRAKEAGLAGRVTFQRQDYRDLDAHFDRIVSIGMFEHVGRDYYDAYFSGIARLLDTKGIAVVHTIGRSTEPSPTNPWVEKYIFPGGYLPSLSEIMPSIERAGLIVTDIEVLRLHYAETLRVWRERFRARRDEAKALYDERFCRMWEFYLAGSEATFRYEGQVVFQIQLAKCMDAVPLTRDYIEAAEASLKEIESPAPQWRMAGE
ncbi:SAM-dependent methyltransferase [Methyloferula stellata]|uniref:SAM-dependent methyltransferase n=1 Tax=Methyloferula stellata TaxID=876270 RepID=UPI0003660B6B|nr:cyclopropane-fatty-acyl-phospholipid synthase family protein [Methyloferula stellata]